MAFNYFKAADHVTTYCKFRPKPPKELTERILSFLKEGGGSLDVAVDVGCGSGQSTTILSPFFSTVTGLEPSADAVKLASKENAASNVSFRVSSAEALDFNNGSVDLVATTQAVHWFDKPKFYSEVARILSKHGVLAICGYRLPQVKTNETSSVLSSIIKKYYCEVLKDYVLPESRQVYLENYRQPIYTEVSFVEGKRMTWEDGFTTELDVTLSEITGYISTWSGFQNFTEKNGTEAGQELLKGFQNELIFSLGKPPTSPITVQYEYFLLLGRKADEEPCNSPNS